MSPNGNLTFTVSTPVTVADTVCTVWWLGACKQANPDGRDVITATTGPPSQTVSLDASDVVPVGIKSLTVSPNPVDGGRTRPPLAP